MLNHIPENEREDMLKVMKELYETRIKFKNEQYKNRDKLMEEWIRSQKRKERTEKIKRIFE